MNIYELVVLAFSLSLDSFCTAVCKGMENNIRWKYTLLTCILFSLSQSLMPLFGYLLGYLISTIIIKLGHFFSFIILLILGINMIKESSNINENDVGFSFKTIFFLAIAISIDAFSVGITFINLNVDIILAVSIIFIITFITSLIGLQIGKRFGSVFNGKILVFGGLSLIALGIKVLLV